MNQILDFSSQLPFKSENMIVKIFQLNSHSKGKFSMHIIFVELLLNLILISNI